MVRLIFSMSIALMLVGCAAANQNIDVDAALSDELATKFVSGKLDLDCDTSCSGRWGASRRQALKLYWAKDWKGLSKLVITVGFDVNLAWYYMGVSAQELGLNAAAKKYYEKTIAISNGVDDGLQCDFVFNNCDGFNLPHDAMVRLDSL